MAGYKNRIIHLTFPELGDDIWVDILNPKLAGAAQLQSDLPLEWDEHGNLTPETRNNRINAGFSIQSKLIVRWNVYDPMDTSDDPRPLPLPATIDLLKQLPLDITQRITEEVGKARARETATT